jgi:hypothetical protein
MLSSKQDFFISGTTPRVDTAVRKRIGEILLERGKVDAAGLERALRVQQESGEKLGSLLVTLGVCAQRDVTEALAAQLACHLSMPRLPGVSDPRGADLRAVPARGGALARGRAARACDGRLTDEYTIGAFRMVTGRYVKALVAIRTSSMRRLNVSTVLAVPRSARSSATSSSEATIFVRCRRPAAEGLRRGSAGDPLVSLIIMNATRARRTSISSRSRIG